MAESIRIATNRSSWAWEDDADTIEALLYYEPDDKEFYLKLTRTHEKFGLGKGVRTEVLEDVRVGNLRKVDVLKIKSLLKKHGHEKSSAGRGFRGKWQPADDPRKEANLSDIIYDFKEQFGLEETERLEKQLKEKKLTERPFPKDQAVKDVVDELEAAKDRLRKSGVTGIGDLLDDIDVALDEFKKKQIKRNPVLDKILSKLETAGKFIAAEEIRLPFSDTHKHEFTKNERRILNALKRKGANMIERLSEDEYDILIEFEKGERLKMKTAMKLMGIVS